ncbi:MAG: phytoene/squalene synthase family protein [Spirochaetota bacterium]
MEVSGNKQQQIFKAGSKTYYTSSLLFPRKKRQEVSVLYAFVRVADNYVDAVPQDKEGFYRFSADYREAWKHGLSSDRRVIDDFIALQREKQFDPSWTEAFLHSMELDLFKQAYETMDETLEYIYGSAEVIGLYMNRILGIAHEADDYAKLLGRAMQYINFIRDIDEDVALGRRYLPNLPEGLQDLSKSSYERCPELFTSFIREQIDQYEIWQQEAEKGYTYLPRRYRIPIVTAAQMYRWTARTIWENPSVVFEQKVKPSSGRIFSQAVRVLFAGGRIS